MFPNALFMAHNGVSAGVHEKVHLSNCVCSCVCVLVHLPACWCSTAIWYLVSLASLWRAPGQQLAHLALLAPANHRTWPGQHTGRGNRLRRAAKSRPKLQHEIMQWYRIRLLYTGTNKDLHVKCACDILKASDNILRQNVDFQISLTRHASVF